LIFDEVTGKNKLAPFSWPTVYNETIVDLITCIQ